MKPFELLKAISGRKLVTRKGSYEVIAFKYFSDLPAGQRRSVALLKVSTGDAVALSYYDNGQADKHESALDLLLATTKKTQWVALNQSKLRPEVFITSPYTSDTEEQIKTLYPGALAYVSVEVEL